MREKFKKFYEIYTEISVLLIVTLFSSMYLGISYILGYGFRIALTSNGSIDNRVDINNTIDAIILGQVLIAALFVIVCVIKFIFKTIRVLHLRFLIRKRLYDFDTEPRYSKSGIILSLRERLGDVVVSSKYISAIDDTKLEDIERRYCFRFKASDDPECEIFKKI